MKFNTKEKFDMTTTPPNPKRYLMPVEWVGSMAMTTRAKINRIDCQGLKKPYLLLCSHASMRDFPMAVRAVFPHRCHWVISVEEFQKREWLLRSVGGFGKRKFTNQIEVVKHIMDILKKKRMICAIYPEARFTLAGVNERIDGALGKLVKRCEVPVVYFQINGNFLDSPQWCKTPKRKIPCEGNFKQIITKEECKRLSAEEIQKRIEDAFHYDEYAWQRDHQIEVKSEYRAHNIHRILYQCPCCGTEFSTDSAKTEIWCNACGARWEMDVYGQLSQTAEGNPMPDAPKKNFAHVPDWYRWERANVEAQVAAGTYSFTDEARLERLESSKKGFREIGTVQLTHDKNGFTVEGKLEDDTNFRLNRTTQSMISCHIEYDYQGRGDAIDLPTLDETYWVFPKNAHNVLTKLHFATEALHDFYTKKR